MAGHAEPCDLLTSIFPGEPTRQRSSIAEVLQEGPKDLLAHKEVMVDRVSRENAMVVHFHRKMSSLRP
jgi:hypothetical protein